MFDLQGKHYREEMMRRADRERLVRIALAGRRPLYKRVLAGIGRSMIALGSSLQHYSEKSSSFPVSPQQQDGIAS